MGDGGTDRFDALMASLAEPMFIVTTSADDGERSGCLVGFATQCSIDPPRFLACLSDTNHTARVAARAVVLAVHVVPAGRHDLAEHFGGTSGDDLDKFADVDWRPGPGGVPLLEACPDRFVGRILERIGLGDHTGYLLAPLQATARGGGEAVTLPEVTDITPGHAP